MYPIRLNQIGMTPHPFEQERYPGEVKLFCEIDLQLVKGMNVVGSVVGWERHPCQ